MSNDLTAYAMPSAEDFESSSQQRNRQYWRTGGAKADYPGCSDFIVRPLPALPGRKAKVRVCKHVWQLPNGKYFVHLCPIGMRVPGGACVSCEMAKDLARNNPLDDKLIKGMQFKEIDLLNVILRDDPDRGPVVHEANWAFNQHSKDMIVQGVNPFDISPEGYDMLIHVPRKNSGERWGYKSALKSSALHADPAQARAWIEMALDLEAEATPPSYEAQQKQYQRLVESAGHTGSGKPQGQSYVAHSAPQRTAPQAATVRRAPPVSDGGNSGLE